MLVYISVNLVNIVYIKVKSRFVSFITSETLQAFLELFARSHGLYFMYKNNNHHLLMLVLY